MSNIDIVFYKSVGDWIGTKCSVLLSRIILIADCKVVLLGELSMYFSKNLIKSQSGIQQGD